MVPEMTRAQFVPESKRHGDRYPRTLEEAFGPGAQLDIEPNQLPGTALIPWIIIGAVAVLYVYIFCAHIAP